MTIAAARAGDQSRDEVGELTYAEDDSEEEERETETRVREGLEKEELRGLGADLQEALVVEDLLFVLMVRRIPRSWKGVGTNLLCRVSRDSTSNTTLLSHPKTSTSGYTALSL